MTDSISRRDWVKVVGAAGAGSLVPLESAQSRRATGEGTIALPVETRAATGDIVDATSTSDVYIPPRGRSWMKFSFDFPEPSVVVGAHRFGFLVFTEENTYAMDRAGMRANVTADGVQLTCDGFTWAGGQEKSPGKLTAMFRTSGTTIEWDVTVESPKPVKTVTSVVRDVPRGQVSFGGGQLLPARNDGDYLGGYTFGAGDLHGAGTPDSMSTPIAVLQAAENDFIAFRTLDTRVRPKRFYFQCGEKMFRTECIYEHDGWRNDTRVTVPTWRIAHAPTLEAAVQPHIEHIERAFNLPAWETRTDVPEWQRKIGLVLTLHGQHYTGYIFNDYAKQLEILRWIATQFPAERTVAFLAAWDGRYYWDYPNYVADKRMGGEAGFRTLIKEGQKLGFRMMPMFGANSANRKGANWPKYASGSTYKIDGDLYNLNWVDWNNDRHQDGWLTYMNLGADSWRNWMTARIADCIERYGVDAYFLDIVGGHVNATTGDMHEGTKRLVLDLRAKYPKVVCIGEMPYDALYEFIPMYHAGGGGRWTKYARFFSHLSAPAPGRGSSGVHESGFGRFNETTLGIGNGIPTLQIVDDTFTKHRDTMSAVIAKAKERAGL